MKKIFVLGFVLALFVSCGNNNEKKETYAGDIQDTFFSVKFGASKEEVKANFLNKGFKIVNDGVVDGVDNLFMEHDENIHFGGYTWEGVTVSFINNRFNGIVFLMTLDRNPKLKTVEARIFQDILSDLSKKYNMRKDYGEYITYSAAIDKKSVSLMWDVEGRLIMLTYIDVTFDSYLHHIRYIERQSVRSSSMPVSQRM